MTTLYLIRHAHSVWREDEARPLSESGARAARALAMSLASCPVDAIYSSPYRRAIETVAPLAEQRRVSITLHDDLRERALPPVTPDRFVQQVADAWADPQRALVGGESNVAAQARGLVVVRDIITRHAGEHVVVSTHGNMLALILNALDATYDFEFWRGLSHPDVYQLELEQTSITRVARMWHAAA